MSESYKNTLLIIRDVVFGEDNYHYDDFLTDDIDLLYQQFHKHSLVHILACKLMRFEKIDFSKGVYKKIQQAYLREIRRLSRQDVIAENIEDIFEKNKIEYIFLKGDNNRKLYPERWMRNSNDIDILVREKDFEKGKKLLSDELNSKILSDSTHHSEIITQKNTIVELHKCALSNPDDQKKEINGIIWNTAAADIERKYKKIISKNMNYLHHILHMKSHFYNGGCGIRFFVDLFLLNRNLTDKDKLEVNGLLKKYNIDKFATECSSLAENWFGNNKVEYSKELEKYVVEGGAFGVLSQRVLINQDSKSKYVIHRIFPTYERLVLQYPKLKGHKSLMPYYEIKRLIQLTKLGYIKKFKAETKSLKSTTDDEVDEYRKLKKTLGF